MTEQERWDLHINQIVTLLSVIRVYRHEYPISNKQILLDMTREVDELLQIVEGDEK